MKFKIITIVFLMMMTAIPACAEPPIHTWVGPPPTMQAILNASPPLPPKTKWQKFKRFTKKYGMILIRVTVNGLEVAGSVAQLLQYIHHP